MSLVGSLLGLASDVKARVEQMRWDRRWARCRALGMHIGNDVCLPASTWVDSTHCYLISIGDHCGFGDGCIILSHDAQMDEFLDAARVGRVTIHPSCHIGARTVILAGVEIGPRTIVGANSVVSKTLPPNTVCAGNPAKVICSIDEYLEKHRARIQNSPKFDFSTHGIANISPKDRAEVMEATRTGSAYVLGGRTAELQGGGDTRRT
jgi:maltose O-acetyltransferase